MHPIRQGKNRHPIKQGKNRFKRTRQPAGPAVTGSGASQAIEPAVKGSGAGHTIYLTFDDGPHPATEGILKLLQRLDVQAAFFINAKNVAVDPDPGDSVAGTPAEKMHKFLRGIIGRGHVLANHTYAHWPMTLGDYTKARVAGTKAEFQRNVAELELVAPLWTMQAARLPGGGPSPRADASQEDKTRVRQLKSDLVAMIRADLHVPHVGWGFEFSDTVHTGRNGSLVHRDWQGVTGAVATRAGIPSDGDVILLHDMDWGGGHLDILEKLILLLRDFLGFTVAPLWKALERRDSLHGQIVYPDVWSFHSTPTAE
jgi:peptidoglycan/xylan/chitin deacetylase (PgdA/CDA1 family)